MSQYLCQSSIHTVCIWNLPTSHCPDSILDWSHWCRWISLVSSRHVSANFFLRGHFFFSALNMQVWLSKNFQTLLETKGHWSHIFGFNWSTINIFNTCIPSMHTHTHTHKSCLPSCFPYSDHQLWEHKHKQRAIKPLIQLYTPKQVHTHTHTQITYVRVPPFLWDIKKKQKNISTLPQKGWEVTFDSWVNVCVLCVSTLEISQVLVPQSGTCREEVAQY